MRNIFIDVVLLIVSLCSVGPTSAQTGIGTTTPDANAILDIHSDHKGVLLPRLNTAQQATLKTILTAAQAGMLVIDSASGKIVYWAADTANKWRDLSGTSLLATPPLTISSINNIALNPGTAPGDLITWDGNNWVNMQPAVQHFSIAQDNRQPLLTLNYCIALSGIFPSQNGQTPFLAEIQLFSFDFAPKGFAFCNGQLLPINQNQALFSLLGTTYGGNGTNNFALPNLRGRVPVHFGRGTGLSPYTLGQTGGTESNTITQ